MAKSDRYVVGRFGNDIGSSKVGVRTGRCDDGDGLEVAGRRCPSDAPASAFVAPPAGLLSGDERDERDESNESNESE
jgi:hypothetical protein